MRADHDSMVAEVLKWGYEAARKNALIFNVRTETVGEVLYLAGIYHKDPKGDRLTILTREAEGCMTGILHRMPLILHREELEKWLFSIMCDKYRRFAVFY